MLCKLNNSQNLIIKEILLNKIEKLYNIFNEFIYLEKLSYEYSKYFINSLSENIKIPKISISKNGCFIFNFDNVLIKIGEDHDLFINYFNTIFYYNIFINEKGILIYSDKFRSYKNVPNFIENITLKI